jgi:hypothetical protein
VSRDVVLATMVLVVCGAGVWLMGLVRAPHERQDDAGFGGLELERRSWRRLCLPMLPAAIVLATLFGWALQEPSVTDEPLRPLAMYLAVPFGLLWLRCAVRACLSLRRPRLMPMVATAGLIRPTILLADRLDQVLDPAAFAAAVAHERAHARHYDPLRIWLAQIMTDVQWPHPAAQRRLDRWLVSLELARDDEARLGGTRGEDLAAAVVAVAKMAPFETSAAIASLTGKEAALASRVHRLLDPLQADGHVDTPVVPLVIAAAIAFGVVAGVKHGDLFLRALPFIAT